MAGISEGRKHYSANGVREWEDDLFKVTKLSSYTYLLYRQSDAQNLLIQNELNVLLSTIPLTALVCIGRDVKGLLLLEIPRQGINNAVIPPSHLEMEIEINVPLLFEH